MDENEQQRLWNDIEKSSHDLQLSERISLIEERVPALFRAFDAERTQGLSETSSQNRLAGVLSAARNTEVVDVHANSESQAHPRSQDNGHRDVWTSSLRVVSARLKVRSAELKGSRRLPQYAMAFAVIVVATVSLLWLRGGGIARRRNSDYVAVKPGKRPHRLIYPPRPAITEKPSTTVKKDNGTQRRHARQSGDSKVRPSEKSNRPEGLISDYGTEYVQRDRIGSFIKVVGAPTMRAFEEKTGRTIRPSDGVYTAVRIETGDTDRAEIRFDDGSSVVLDFNTALEIPQNQNSQTTKSSNGYISRPAKIDLLIGRIWAQVHKSTSGKKFEVETPVATAAVRGTEFGLKVQYVNKRGTKINPSRSITEIPLLPLEAVLTVKEGRVDFGNSAGTVSATDMMESTAIADRKPSDPMRIGTLKTFRLSRLNLVVRTYRLRFPHAAHKLVHPFGWTGLTVKDVPDSMTDDEPQITRPRVIRVVRDSPAQNAGLHVGDMILAVNDTPVTSADEALNLIPDRPDKRVTITIHRNRTKDNPGTKETVTFSTGHRIDGAPQPKIAPDDAKPLYDATALLIHGRTQEARIALGTLVPNPDVIAQSLVSDRRLAGIPTTRYVAFDSVVKGSRSGSEAEKRTRDAFAISRNGAAHNNLGVLYEIEDRIGKAVWHYQRAVQAEPSVALYHYNLGIALKNAGNLDRAVEELETAVSLAPTWSDAHTALADIYSLLRWNEKAAKETEQALRCNPESPDAWMTRYEILLRERRSDEARKAVERAMELEPDNAEASRNISTLQVDRSELEAAEKRILRALELDPTSARAYNMLGIILSGRGQNEQAERMFLKSIELDTEYAPIPYSNLAGLYKSLSKWEDAELQLQRAIDTDPTYIGAYKDLGDIYLRRREYEKAETNYRRVAESGDEDLVLTALIDLGRIYRVQGKLERTEQSFRRALELDPSFIRAYIQLGELYWEQAHLELAEKIYNQAKERDPENPLSYLGLASVYEARGEEKNAEEVLRYTIEQFHDVYAYFQLGCLYIKRDRIDEAERLFRDAMEIDAKHLVPYTGLACISRMRGNYNEAESFYRKILEFDPDNSYAYYNLGVMYCYDLHRLDEAEKYFRKAIELYGQECNVYTDLGELYRLLGKWDKAEQSYRKALQFNPSFILSYFGLGHMYRDLNQADQAESMYLRAMELYPNFDWCSEHLLAAGHFFREMKQFDRSEQFLRKAMELPTCRFARFSLIWVLADQPDRLDEALQQAESQLDKSPDNAEAWLTLGYVHFRRGHLQQAETALKRAIDIPKPRLRSRRAWIWRLLGQVYEQKGDTVLAVNAYRSAIKLWIGDRYAAEALKRLEDGKSMAD